MSDDSMTQYYNAVKDNEKLLKNNHWNIEVDRDFVASLIYREIEEADLNEDADNAQNVEDTKALYKVFSLLFHISNLLKAVLEMDIDTKAITALKAIMKITYLTSQACYVSSGKVVTNDHELSEFEICIFALTRYLCRRRTVFPMLLKDKSRELEHPHLLLLALDKWIETTVWTQQEDIKKIDFTRTCIWLRLLCESKYFLRCAAIYAQIENPKPIL